MIYNYSEKNVDLAIGNILKYNNLLLVGGNGGSCEQSSHFVAELTGSFEKNNSYFPAFALGTNSAELTAIANDMGYDDYFVRMAQVFNHLQPTFMFITTSGISKNIEHALHYLIYEIKYSQDKIILLTGIGDKIKKYIKESDINIITCDYDKTYEIQECHMHILHKIAYGIKFFN